MKRHLTVCATAAAFVSVIATSAQANWSTTATRGTSTAGKTAALAAPSAPAATSSSSSSTPPTATSGVYLTWRSGALSAAARAGTVKHHVQRLPLSATPDWSAATSICGTSDAAPLAMTSCTDANTTAGSYLYLVTSAVGSLWREAGSPTTVVVPSAAPVATTYKITLGAVGVVHSTQQWRPKLQVIVTDNLGNRLNGYTISGTWSNGGGSVNCTTAADGHDGAGSCEVTGPNNLKRSDPNSVPASTFTRSMTVATPASSTLLLDPTSDSTASATAP